MYMYVSPQCVCNSWEFSKLYKNFIPCVCNALHYSIPICRCPSSSLQVYIGDKVVLTPVSTGQPLHVSDLSLPDHPDCREVNADPAG